MVLVSSGGSEAINYARMKPFGERERERENEQSHRSTPILRGSVIFPTSTESLCFIDIGIQLQFARSRWEFGPQNIKGVSLFRTCGNIARKELNSLFGKGDRNIAQK